MARSYDDAVQVREDAVQVREDAVQVREDAVQVREDQGAQEAAGPQAFLWRGRLYVVRGVLAHWYERRAWWTEGAARAVHGQPETVHGQPETVHGQRQMGDPVRQGPPGADREVWRVEASVGRHVGTGVYDLCRSTEGPEPWRLLRVAD